MNVENRISTSRKADPSARARVFVVDDHPIVRRGLACLIERDSRLQVCGTAGQYELALDQLRVMRPNLLIVDLSLRGHSGLDLIRELKSAQSRLRALVFSIHDEALYGPRALRAGASGYVMKHEPVDVLLNAIERILGGGTWFKAQAGAFGTRQPSSNRPVDLLDLLTDRELDVFRLMGQGITTQQAAQILSLSIKTIGAHRINMMAKLGLTNANQLIRYAVQLNREYASLENGPDAVPADGSSLSTDPELTLPEPATLDRTRL